ncbi:hypothetical protein [uncultured Bacteroides sp.]|uniref:hypothetical protein n=1 Tax=uncultured Bacteroides sp. TaxID=162156 RepID=UPI002AABBC76|nr:hypothetical protein [uncultured Bacteroides sp.]
MKKTQTTGEADQFKMQQIENMSMQNKIGYSVDSFSDKKVIGYLEEVKSKIVLNELTKRLIYIKYGKLNILNGLKSIIAEICDCLIIGNNQAAITLTNHLFENALKQVLIRWDSNGKRFNETQRIDETLRDEVKEYDGKCLSAVIEKCNRKGLLTEIEAKKLIELKNNYRNSFSHASYSKLFKNASAVLYSANISNPVEITEETANISTVPFLYLAAQKEFAKRNALKYFFEVYTIVNNMDEKLLDLYPETKEALQKYKENNITMKKNKCFKLLSLFLLKFTTMVRSNRNE